MIETAARNLRTSERFLLEPPISAQFGASPVAVCDISAKGARFRHGQPLERDEAEDDDGKRQAASSSSPAQVKPGPNAVIITLSGRPRSRSRSRTNITVGALMLP